MFRGRRVLFNARCRTCRYLFGVRLPARISALRLVRALTVAHSVARPGCTGGTLDIPMVALMGTPRRIRLRQNLRRKGRR